MGSVCNSQNSSSTLIYNSAKTLNNSSPLKFQEECSLKIIVEAKPNKQFAVQEFTYKLNEHLDSFQEAFFEKSYYVDYQNEVPLKQMDSKSSFNLVIVADPPTFSPKFGPQRITRTQADFGTSNKRKRRQYDQIRRSQEVVRNIGQKSILKTTSKSFDSIQVKKKQVRFGRISVQYRVPKIMILK